MATSTSKKSRLATTVAAVGLAAAMLMGGGTYAYLQSSSDVVNNLFNSNEVKGTTITETTGTSYEVIPGKSITKDPVVKTTASVDFWQFIVVNDETYLGSADGTKNVADWSIADGWTILNDTKDESFILYRSVSAGDNAGTNTEYSQGIIKNDTVTFSSGLTNEDMWNANLTRSMSFQAYAIQKDGFDTAEAAWAQIRGEVPAVDEETVVKGEDTKLNAKIDEDSYSAVIPADSELTLNDGKDTKIDLSDEEAANNLKLEVTADELDEAYLEIVGEGESEVTYDVTLYAKTDNGDYVEVKSCDKPIKVTIDIGVVELVKFYHKNAEYDKKVDSEADVKEVGQFYAKTANNKTSVTFLTNSFSPFSAVVRFDGGIGTKEYPYLIATAGHWVAMCEMNAYGEDYPGQYYIEKTKDTEDYCYIELESDIDLSDSNLPYSCSIENMYLDGNGYTISNVSNSATIFDNDGNCFYGTNVIKDLKLKYCHVDCSLLGYGTQNKAGNSVAFDNVDLDFCSASGGAYLYYAGSGTATFKDCDATNTNISGGYMASGGFVGNIGNGYITIDSCSFGGSVVSTQSACAGFVGQPTWDTSATKVIIKDSTILEGTIIKNIAGGPVAAFEGMNTGVNYAAKGNTFNGKLISSGDKYAQGTSAATEDYQAICTLEDFTFNDDGTITYTGDNELSKIKVSTYVNDDYIYYGSYYGGYNWNIESITKNDVTKDTTISGLTQITGLKNVVTSSETPVGLQVLESNIEKSKIGKIDADGTFYFDARTEGWGHYMLSGTYNSSTGQAVNPSELKVYVNIVVYDENGALETKVSGATLSYEVDLGEE